jgi:hypothetical protein
VLPDTGSDGEIARQLMIDLTFVDELATGKYKGLETLMEKVEGFIESDPTLGGKLTGMKVTQVDWIFAKIGFNRIISEMKLLCVYQRPRISNQS